MSRKRWTISTHPDDLGEGLFGQILLFVFEVLPYVQKQNIRPRWNIESFRYGSLDAPTILPGLFDAVQTPPAEPTEAVSLTTLRRCHRYFIGGDFDATHRLWTTYFAVPEKTLADVAVLQLGDRCLGLHYRGTDKNTTAWDTNPLSGADFLALAVDFAAQRADLDTVFVATDEPEFIADARTAFPHLRVVTAGPGAHHKTTTYDIEMGRGAVRDCVALSQCRHVVKASSALSAFAKVLNPDLDAYRVSASKFAHGAPYFPEAYIPRLQSTSPHCQAILERQFEGDWLEDPQGARFLRPFAWRPRRTPVDCLRSKLNGTSLGRAYNTLRGFRSADRT